MKPVAASAASAQTLFSHHQIHNKESYVPVFCDTESLSADRVKSFTPAATRAHFIIGAQKKMVLGPVG